MFGISKQTLFYYEKTKIFAPNFIDNNGYRYYSLDQYFVFEIIVTLRKLGVSLKEISNYINNRNIEALQNLFSDKILEYELQIELLQRNKHNLLVKLSHLKKTEAVKSNRITLENCEEEYLVVDTFPTLEGNMKNDIMFIAKHNLPFAKSEIINEYLMGYILKKENLLSGKFNALTQIFTQISHFDEYPNALTKPAGLYAKIVTPDGYHVNYKNAIQKLLDFIQLNSLELIGDGYITQLRNYWSTANPKEYVTQVAIQVDYKN